LTSVRNLPLDNPRPPAGLGQSLPLCATYLWSFCKCKYVHIATCSSSRIDDLKKIEKNNNN
jgi:hypothetical protein